MRFFYFLQHKQIDNIFVKLHSYKYSLKQSLKDINCHTKKGNAEAKHKKPINLNEECRAYKLYFNII